MVVLIAAGCSGLLSLHSYAADSGDVRTHAAQSLNRLTQHTGQGDSSKAPSGSHRTVEDRNSYSSDQYLIGKGQGDMAKGRIICQKDSFLCAARGVNVTIAFTKRIGAGFFGGEGFILQRIEGDGLAFLHASGTLHELKLSGAESLRVDTGCIVAMDESVDYDIQMVPGIKTALFGGEGLFFALLKGPGRVILQTMPFSRLADRIIAASPRAGGSRREEGSVLGALGGLLDGDN
jgi:hypothetical protein